MTDNHARSIGFVTRIASSSSIFFLCASFFSASYSSSANLFASRSQPCGRKFYETSTRGWRRATSDINDFNQHSCSGSSRVTSADAHLILIARAA